MFNVRNYSPEVIILPRVNNFDLKQKKHEIFCFITCYHPQTGSGKIKANKRPLISVKTKVFFRKNCTTTYLTTTPSKSFYIFLLFFSEIINP